MRDRLTDILLRRLDTILNPRIESWAVRVIIGAGIALLAVPRFLLLVSAVRRDERGLYLDLPVFERISGIVDVAGIALIVLGAVLLYLFRFHERAEFVIRSDSPSARSWASHGYSFQGEEPISPRIVHDLVGWISDTDQQIVAIDLAGSVRSNRYHGTVTVRRYAERTLVEVHDEEEDYGRSYEGYEYIGTSESGIHVLHAYDRSGGTAVFNYLLLVAIETMDLLDCHGGTPRSEPHVVLKVVGTIALGDRYDGRATFDRGLVRIGPATGKLPPFDVRPGRRILVK